MLAKAHATKITGGNGYRRFLLILHFLLWLATTVLLLVYLAERAVALLPALGAAAVADGIASFLTSIDAVKAPVFAFLGGLFAGETLGLMMFVILLLWGMLLFAWARLLRTGYILCRTAAGTVLYRGKVFQRVTVGMLTVSDSLPEDGWYLDLEMVIPAKPAVRFHAKPIVLFGTQLTPCAEVEEEAAAPQEIVPAVIEEPVKAPVAEPEIRVIIREAEEREAGRASLVAPAPAPTPTPASVAEDSAPAPAPAPTPVAEEPAPIPVVDPAPAPAPVAEEDAEDGDDEELGEVREITVDGKTFQMVIRYSRSFTARVIQAPDFLKAYYSEIKNELMSYSLVKSRISWKYDAFNRGRLQLAKIVVRGKSLCLYLALDPNAYEVEKYHHADQGAKNAYAKVPMMVRIRSDLGLRKAKFLISEMMANFEIEREELADLDYASWYAYKDTKTLIEENLIKELEAPESEE